MFAKTVRVTYHKVLMICHRVRRGHRDLIEAGNKEFLSKGNGGKTGKGFRIK
jgi:hypothetical protein